ncbi:O-antigen ligase family protein [Chitinophaga polysaccharea]|uniref:O-antigen ligase family protein n=1 Tax=Chitinophaga TaxID=79328 RepID=UPI0014550A4B|nr:MULTISPECIES: O-antigen ligase family protein [Chitinophaga]NLR58368.1 O-antigen ligase family protein [Chitinophaga polysaccharea]NLU90895.1 O-antigen ligase family protein [Chitinophaga sp. Ak27]
MNISQRISALLIAVPWLACILYFILRYPFSFNYEIYINNHYTLAWTLLYFPFSLIFFFIISIKPGYIGNSVKTLPNGPGYFVVFTMAIVWVLLLFSNYYSFGNEHFFVCISMFALLCSLLLFNNIDSIIPIIVSLAVAFMFQLYAGYSQLLAVAGSENESLMIRGNLHNSGIYACYLVISFPFFCYILPLKKRAPLIICSIIALAVISLVFVTKSRSAIVAAFVMLLAFAGSTWSKNLRRYAAAMPMIVKLTLSASMTLTLSGAGYYLFQAKRMSALGRMLKIRITWEHITDHFWLGTGLGRFSWYYPQWQSDYFRSHPDISQAEIFSAGESYILFNEYLQLLKEVGIGGFLIFMVALIYIYSTRNTNYSSLLKVTKLTVTGILACSFTTYALHTNIFLLILALCFAISVLVRVSSIDSPPNQNALLTGLMLCLLVLAGMGIYKGLQLYKAIQRWEMLTEGRYNSDVPPQQVYENLYPILQQNGKFLTDYGLFLQENHNTAMLALPILQRSRNYFVSKLTIEQLGKAYAVRGDYHHAIACYEWLGYYLPNRFGVKNDLLRLYKKTADSANIQRVATMIMSMPIKINSPEVEFIKKEAAATLAGNDSIR